MFCFSKIIIKTKLAKQREMMGDAAIENNPSNKPPRIQINSSRTEKEFAGTLFR